MSEKSAFREAWCLMFLYPSGSEIWRFWYIETRGRKIAIEKKFLLYFSVHWGDLITYNDTDHYVTYCHYCASHRFIACQTETKDTRVAFSRWSRSQIVLDRFFVFVFRISDLNLQVIVNVNENEFLINTKAPQNYFVDDMTCALFNFTDDNGYNIKPRKA